MTFNDYRIHFGFLMPKLFWQNSTAMWAIDYFPIQYFSSPAKPAQWKKKRGRCWKWRNPPTEVVI
jgi:hypothetical protein